MQTNLLCVAVLVAADRLFKIAAAAYLTDGAVVLIPGILGLRLLEGGNTGAAFGLFSDSTEVLAVISGICSAVLLIMLIINRFGSQAERWGFVLICAGAMGNLYDRVFCGAVTDYLEFLFCEFPIFNFADVMVDVGCLLVAVCVFFFPDGKKTRAGRSQDADDSEETEDDED